MSQIRIDDRQQRKHARAAQADLDAVFRRDEHCVARYLTPGARRCWYADAWDARLREANSAADENIDVGIWDITPEGKDLGTVLQLVYNDSRGQHDGGSYRGRSHSGD